MTKTYAELTRQIAELQASAQKLRAIEAKGAIAKINEMIATYGLKAADLKFGAAAEHVSGRPAKGKRGAAAAGARFRDGQGNEWAGRGPRPAWLRDAIAAGRTLESFSVEAAAPATPAPMKAVSAKKASANPTASKRGKSPAGTAKPTSKMRPKAAKVSSTADDATPTDGRSSQLKNSRKKVARKVGLEQALSAVGPKQTAEASVKKPAAKKVGAKKIVTTTRASSAGNKASEPKRPTVAKRPVTSKKAAAATKVAATRKRVSPKAPAPGTVAALAAPVPEAGAATASV